MQSSVARNIERSRRRMRYKTKAAREREKTQKRRFGCHVLFKLLLTSRTGDGGEPRRLSDGLTAHSLPITPRIQVSGPPSLLLGLNSSYGDLFKIFLSD
ncbi:hypothetical protein RRG08_056021 [Elysia crispata]|uniref:Uncharacterized protein n=1 Tax=Elysia crispata TaxID=231223 RepID=A0AAE1AGY0_9GAST|nr:hypothetical protein RRG08_056021 [Elysia crispata]